MDSLSAIFKAADEFSQKSHTKESLDRVRELVGINGDKLNELQESIATEICRTMEPASEKEGGDTDLELSYTRKLDDPRVMWVIFDPVTKQPDIFSTTLSANTVQMLNQQFLFKKDTTMVDLKKLQTIAKKLKTQLDGNDITNAPTQF